MTTPTRESDARLPLLESALRDTLALVHLGGVLGRLEGVAGGRKGLEVGTVLFLGLQRVSDRQASTERSDRTKGRPQ